MANIHPSADPRNVERTVLAHLASSLGVPVVPDGDDKFNSATASAFVRVHFAYLPEQFQGIVTDSGTNYRVSRASVLCTASVMAQGNGIGDTVSIDEPQRIAGLAAHAIRYRDLPMKNYTADATGATTVSGVSIRFDKPPQTQRVSPDNGWHRRIVIAEGHWFLRHAE